MKNIALLFLLSAGIAYCQESKKTNTQPPVSFQNGDENQYRDLSFGDWKIPLVQTESRSLAILSDLFEFNISKKDDHLNFAEFQLNVTKWRFVANPRKDSGTLGWTTTKFTEYYDLNGDSEVDLFIKYNSSSKPGPMDKREYIIYHDTIIEIHPQRTKPGYAKEFVALTGEVYKMTPDGWILVK